MRALADVRELLGGGELGSVPILEQLAEVHALQAAGAHHQQEALDALLASCRGALRLPERRDAAGIPAFPPITPSGNTPSKLALGTVPALAAFLQAVDPTGPAAPQAARALCESLQSWHVEQPAFALRSPAQWRALMGRAISRLLGLVRREETPASLKADLGAAIAAMLAGLLQAQARDSAAAARVEALRAAAAEQAAAFAELLQVAHAAELLQQLRPPLLGGAGADASAELLAVALAPHLLAAAAGGAGEQLPRKKLGKLASELETAAVRRLQQALQPMLAAMDDGVLDTGAFEEQIAALELPPERFVRGLAALVAAASLRSTTPEQKADDAFSRALLSGSPRPSSGGSSSTAASQVDVPRSEAAARERAHAASRAALRSAAQRQWDAEGGLTPRLHGAAGAVDCLLDAAEGCLAFCWEAGPGEDLGRAALRLAAALVAELADPLQAVAQTDPQALLDLSARLRSVKLSAALLARQEDPAMQPWQWDLHASLALPAAAAGAEAEALWRLATEVVCAAAAEAWRQGSQLAVEAALVLLGDAPGVGDTLSVTEYQAALLTLGRLVVLLEGEEQLLRLAVPLLAGGPPPAAAPHALASLSHCLACVAAQAVAAGARWAFDQSLDVLLKAYGGGSSSSGQPEGLACLLHAAQPPADCAGALAGALLALARRMGPAPEPLRADLELRLLSLFSELGLEARSEAQVRDLGELLPAIAAAWHEAGAQPSRSLMASSSVDFQVLQAHQRSEAKLVHLYRVLWMHVAVHRLWKDTPGRQRPAWPAEWREAAVSIARGPTPLLVAGGELDAARVDAEFGERARRLCKALPPLQLAAKLLEGVSPGQVPPAGLIAASGHPARNAHLLSTLVVNLLRTELGAQPAEAAACPLAPLFKTQQAAASGSWELPWLAAIAERVTEHYIEQLAAASSQAAADRQLLLAQTLVSTLRPAASSARLRDSADGLLGRLLRRCPSLLWTVRRRRKQLAGAGGELQGRGSEPQGEGREPPGCLLGVLLAAAQETDAAGYRTGVDPRVSGWIKWVVETASHRAPGLAEAQLHELLARQSEAGAAQEAQGLLSVAQAAAAHSPLSILGTTPTGVAALAQKARFAGLLTGAAVGQPAKTVLAGLAGDELLQGCQRLDGPEQLGRLHDGLLEAAAALVTLPEAPARAALLRTLARAPLRSLRPATLRTAVFAWQWVATAAPELQVPLLAEVTAAWSDSLRARVGLATPQQQQAGSGEAAAAGAASQELTEGVAAHHLWLLFLLEAWQAWGASKGASSRAVAALMLRWAAHSLAAAPRMTQHPLAVGAYFRMLLLALRVTAHAKAADPQSRQAAAHALRLAGVLRAALGWFSAELAYHGAWTAQEDREELAAVADFHRELLTEKGAPREAFKDWLPLKRTAFAPASLAHLPAVPAAEQRRLLRLLLDAETKRLQVWGEPLASTPGRKTPSASAWEGYAATAWVLSPRLAVSLISRFPSAAGLRAAVARRVAAEADSPDLRSLPAAAELLASSRQPEALARLQAWAAAPVLQALSLLAGKRGAEPAVRAFALRSLQACPAEQVAFFLPQLVQLLRSDGSGQVQQFLVTEAQRSTYFAHHLVCTLRSEGTPPKEAFSPAVKRSGWQPPKDSGLWAVADAVQQKVWAALPPERRAHLEAELAYFDAMVGVSGQLYAVPKDERKAAAVGLVQQIQLPREDLYMPTDPGSRVLAAVPQSAAPMQSAAKVPILVAFKVEQQQQQREQQQQQQQRAERVQACIFKVGDDCRQDVLALQVISLLRDAFKRAGLGLYLAPYGVLPTAYECGIIQCVPDTRSRSALGETADGGLLEIWCREFGAPGSPSFEAARRNFIVSAAGYAIACFLLQAKDRHNGNILFDSQGHLVHIDFGFILEISPGGNLGFESAAFKLSHEMTQLLDPGGARRSPQFALFQELCVRGFLAARTVAEGIITSVALMAGSGLPCFGRGAPLPHLRQRFRLQLNDAQAAAFMRGAIADAYDKWTTGFYDFVQYLQNAIPK